MRMRSQQGFTLLELMIIVSIVGIMVAVASPSFRMIRKHRVDSASSELLSSLQNLRSQSMTSASSPDSRGFGVKFTSSGYDTFEFEDCNGNFKYEDDGCASSTPEELNPRTVVLPSDIEITKKNATMPSGEMLFFDKHGFARNGSWGLSSITIVVRHRSGEVRPKCIVADAVRIWEGNWNADTCE